VKQDEERGEKKNVGTNLDICVYRVTTQVCTKGERVVKLVEGKGEIRCVSSCVGDRGNGRLLRQREAVRARKEARGRLLSTSPKGNLEHHYILGMVASLVWLWHWFKPLETTLK
jgi:hypothetical protein